MLADRHGQHASHSGEPEHHGQTTTAALLNPLASITEVTVKPSGILWRKMAKKITQPSHGETGIRQ